MVTFSDCMTLLLTFFVLLLSFTTFDKVTFDELSDTFGEAIPGVDPSINEKKNTFVVARPNRKDVKDKGSLTPTATKKITQNTIKETDPKNFRTLRVFSMPSQEAFLASGKALSPKAKETLDLMAQFIDKMPSRVVICETGPGSQNSSPFFGYPRAFEIMLYLKSKGVPENLMNITQTNTINQNSWTRLRDRQVQITLLERQIHEH